MIYYVNLSVQSGSSPRGRSGQSRSSTVVRATIDDLDDIETPEGKTAGVEYYCTAAEKPIAVAIVSKSRYLFRLIQN